MNLAGASKSTTLAEEAGRCCSGETAAAVSRNERSGVKRPRAGTSPLQPFQSPLSPPSPSPEAVLSRRLGAQTATSASTAAAASINYAVVISSSAGVVEVSQSSLLALQSSSAAAANSPIAKAAAASFSLLPAPPAALTAEQPVLSSLRNQLASSNNNGKKDDQGSSRHHHHHYHHQEQSSAVQKDEQQQTSSWALLPQSESVRQLGSAVAVGERQSVFTQPPLQSPSASVKASSAYFDFDYDDESTEEHFGHFQLPDLSCCCCSSSDTESSSSNSSSPKTKRASLEGTPIALCAVYSSSNSLLTVSSFSCTQNTQMSFRSNSQNSSRNSSRFQQCTSDHSIAAIMSNQPRGRPVLGQSQQNPRDSGHQNPGPNLDAANSGSRPAFSMRNSTTSASTANRTQMRNTAGHYMPALIESPTSSSSSISFTSVQSPHAVLDITASQVPPAAYLPVSPEHSQLLSWTSASGAVLTIRSQDSSSRTRILAAHRGAPHAQLRSRSQQQFYGNQYVDANGQPHPSNNSGSASATSREIGPSQACHFNNLVQSSSPPTMMVATMAAAGEQMVVPLVSPFSPPKVPSLAESSTAFLESLLTLDTLCFTVYVVADGVQSTTSATPFDVFEVAVNNLHGVQDPARSHSQHQNQQNPRMQQQNLLCLVIAESSFWQGVMMPVLIYLGAHLYKQRLESIIARHKLPLGRPVLREGLQVSWCWPGKVAVKDGARRGLASMNMANDENQDVKRGVQEVCHFQQAKVQQHFRPSSLPIPLATPCQPALPEEMLHLISSTSALFSPTLGSNCWHFHEQAVSTPSSSSTTSTSTLVASESSPFSAVLSYLDQQQQQLGRPARPQAFYAPLAIPVDQIPGMPLLFPFPVEALSNAQAAERVLSHSNWAAILEQFFPTQEANLQHLRSGEGFGNHLRALRRLRRLATVEGEQNQNCENLEVIVNSGQQLDGEDDDGPEDDENTEIGDLEAGNADEEYEDTETEEEYYPEEYEEYLAYEDFYN